MNKTLISAAAAAVLGTALPALAGYPIGFYDPRFPLQMNRARENFPSSEPSSSPPPTERAHGQPYALTGTTQATSPSSKWTITVERYGRYPQIVYRR